MKVFFFLVFSIFLSLGVHSMSQERIAVLDFNTSGVSENEMILFVDYLASQVAQHEDYILIDRRQRENILQELSFSLSGCTDAECQLEIGRLLSATYIVVGSIGSIGSVYILNMHIVDVETSATINTVSEQYKKLDDLVKDSKKLVNLLLKYDRRTSDENIVVQQSVPIVEGNEQIIKSDIPSNYFPVLLQDGDKYTFKDKNYNGVFSHGSLALELLEYLPLNGDNIELKLRIKTNKSAASFGAYGGAIIAITSTILTLATVGEGEGGVGPGFTEGPYITGAGVVMMFSSLFFGGKAQRDAEKVIEEYKNTGNSSIK
ncbi:MAG: hypothetical protein KAH95_03800 [Spirochaetales bacterium]|nr:hypothetical protein [Spirochaetales bacterium]